VPVTEQPASGLKGWLELTAFGEGQCRDDRDPPLPEIRRTRETPEKKAAALGQVPAHDRGRGGVRQIPNCSRGSVSAMSRFDAARAVCRGLAFLWSAIEAPSGATPDGPNRIHNIYIVT
jgi:hypothetical protein